MKTHAYIPDAAYVDHHNVPICTCGSRKDDRIHQLPQQNPDIILLEQRRIGERNG